MPSNEARWENSGAFPSREKGSSSNYSSRGDKIFVNDSFDGQFDTLDTVNEGSRETLSSSHDGLMALSHSSSETPAMNNTTTVAVRNAVVRNALKKKKVPSNNGCKNRVEKIYPYSVFRSLPKRKQEGEGEGEEQKTKSAQKSNENSFGTRSPIQPANTVNKTEKDNLDHRKSERPPSLPSPLISAIDDEISSVITDDNQEHEHRQFLYDYMAEGASVKPPMSVMSARSRRHGGGSKHHIIRHTLATTQKVAANPSNMMKNLFVSIEEERHLHRLTAQHLRAIHNWLLFLPSILFALVAGLVVFIFEADINSNEEIHIYSSIFVGVLSMLSVFGQALCKQLDLGVKSSIHDACSVALKRLSEDIQLTMSAAETIPAEYIALIGEKYGQAADSCAFMIPCKLEAAASHLSDRMNLMLRPPPMAKSSQQQKCNLKQFDLLRIYGTAYDELTTEIINYPAFPFIIPDPRNVSEAALRNLKSIITEGKEVSRSRWCWRSTCPCVGATEEERNLFDVLPSVDPFRSQQSF